MRRERLIKSRFDDVQQRALLAAQEGDEVGLAMELRMLTTQERQDMIDLCDTIRSACMDIALRSS